MTWKEVLTPESPASWDPGSLAPGAEAWHVCPSTICAFLGPQLQRNKGLGGGCPLTHLPADL